jgi:hypothetical protein
VNARAPGSSKAALKSSLEQFIANEDRAAGQHARSYQIGGDHYLNMGIQPWDAMRAWMTPEEFQGFLRGNAIKYIARFRAKGGVQDLRKAMHYLETLVAELERTQTNPLAPNPNPQE